MMLQSRLIICGVILLNLFKFNCACKGCIDLDEYNFDKVLSKFKVVLVKFDVAYPYGEKHDVFSEVSKDIRDIPDLIFAQVGIKDYGEKDNEELGKRYGVNSKDDLPTLRLFVQGKDEPFTMSEDSEWSQEHIKTFIRDNTDLYIGLTGCLEEFDKLAVKFASSDDKQSVLKEAEDLATKLQSKRDQVTANIYTKFMSKIIEKGSFVNQELARLNKLLKQGKLNEKKKTELSNKINILKSFRPPKTEL